MNFSIGLSGLQVAQRALEIIGTNIANAGTEGYHRQEPRITSMVLDSKWDTAIAGAKIEGVRRAYDLFLEREINYSQPRHGEILQELEMLQSVENVLAEPDAGGLTTALSDYFNAVQDLAVEPSSLPQRQQLVQAGATLAGQFNTLGAFFLDLDEHIIAQAQTLAGRVNSLATEIADLNAQVESVQLSGRNANLLLDGRDRALTELAGLADVTLQRQNSQTDQINVSVWGTNIVLGKNDSKIEISLQSDGSLGVSPYGAYLFRTDITGGRLGGLVNVKNTILADIRGNVDALAKDIVTQVNRLHVQGVGTAGSFTELAGVTVDLVAAVTDWDTGVTAGDFYVRLISPAGNVERHKVTVATGDTLQDVVDKINALPTANLEAAIVGSALKIRGLNSYQFDFLPAEVLDATGLTGGSVPTITTSGIYSGATNETYTLTVSAPNAVSGEIGKTNGLELTVTNAANQVVTRLNVGLGYAAGDPLPIEDGLRLALSIGTLNHGETVTVVALADSDTTGFLAAAGMNTFFSGTSATNIAVRAEILANPSRVATARGDQGLDNVNALRIAALGEQKSAALGGLTPVEHYRQTVTMIGQNVSIRKARRKSIESILRELENQRDDVSGVDLNDEAAKLIVFERLFQAAAKFVAAQDRAMQELLQII